MSLRPLTIDENKQLDITKLFHEKRLNERMNWNKIMVAALAEVVSVVLIYYLDDNWASYFAKFAVAVLPLWIWLDLSEFKSNRKESIKLLDIIGKIESQRGVVTTKYECEKAIHFEEHYDEADCYALEVGENKLMFWWDPEYSEGAILPNSRFEVYNDEQVELIFRTRIRVLGQPFQAIKIRSEIKRDVWGELPGHREIIDSTVDVYLQNIEQRYRK